jgi:hypothetical protein
MSMSQKKWGLVLQIFSGLVFLTTPVFFRQDFKALAPHLVERTIQSLEFARPESFDPGKVISSRVMRISEKTLSQTHKTVLQTDTVQSRIEIGLSNAHREFSLFRKSPPDAIRQAATESLPKSEWIPLKLRKNKNSWTTDFLEFDEGDNEFKLESFSREILKKTSTQSPKNPAQPLSTRFFTIRLDSTEFPKQQ